MATDGKYILYSIEGSKGIGNTDEVGDSTNSGKIKITASHRDHRRQ
jgi:hypothetical protein